MLYELETLKELSATIHKVCFRDASVTILGANWPVELSKQIKTGSILYATVSTFIGIVMSLVF